MPELFEYDTGVRFVRPRGLDWCGWGNDIFWAKVAIKEAFLVVAIVPLDTQESGESGKGEADYICNHENYKIRVRKGEKGQEMTDHQRWWTSVGKQAFSLVNTCPVCT
ncbi:hypothetical protein H2248_002334 [Termitomyces sp. 'cryptogamus']|nr:hypothetical protein H2248_002334 [Termitomyces sp. 'cryptogamus']